MLLSGGDRSANDSMLTRRQEEMEFGQRGWPGQRQRVGENQNGWCSDPKAKGERSKGPGHRGSYRSDPEAQVHLLS